MKQKDFYEPVFHADVIFLFDCDPKEVNGYFKKYKLEAQNYEETSGSVTLIDKYDKKGRKTREYLVIVEDKRNFYTLLHETVHLTRHILRDRGIPLTGKNDEVVAYYQDFWFRQLWRAMSSREVVLKKKRQKGAK